MVTDVRSSELIRRVLRHSDPGGEAATEIARRVADGDARTVRLLTLIHDRYPTQCDLATHALAISDPATVAPLRRAVFTLSKDQSAVREILGKIFQSQLDALGIDAERLARAARGIARDALAKLAWKCDSDYAADLAQDTLSIFLRRLILRPIPANWVQSLASITLRTAKGQREKERRRLGIIRNRFGPEYRAWRRMAEHEDAMMFVSSMALKYDVVDQLPAAFDRLTKDERDVIELHVRRGQSFQNTAKSLGMTLYRVLDLYRSALHKLRQGWKP